jgi:tRNA(fMet)-specific endonuclease VapC
MGSGLVLGADFLVDLEGEAHSGEPGPAHWFLAENRDRELCITLTTAAELARGPQRDERNAWETFINRFRIVAQDPDTCWAYGQIFQYLTANDIQIGHNELSVASVAVVHGLTLVTRDPTHFRRVPGLKVMTYAGLLS